MSTIEFAPITETCTAVIHLEITPGGEAYVGPIAIGFYNSDELWMECEGSRIPLPEKHLTEILRQIKRARKIAAEYAKDQA